jgi:putative membrane protein
MVLAVNITPLDLLTRAVFAPGALIIIGLGAFWYLRAVRDLGAHGRQWQPARTASFLIAAAAALVALVSGLASYVPSSFTIGAIQHILIGMVAPIFLVLSSPLTLARQSSPARVAATVQRVVESRPIRVLSRPAVAWPVYGTWLFVLYLSPLYAETLHHDALRQVVNLVTFGVGCLFFWPAASSDRFAKPPAYWLRMLYLILLMPCHTILGMALESQSNSIAKGISLTDLHTGGGLLWVAGEATGLLGTIALFVAWLRSDERAAKRNDEFQQASAAAALAHWRATRDAAARAASSRIVPR